MQLTIFAHLGRVTAIAFPGEATNYNGMAVSTLDVPDDADILTALADAGIAEGVGAVWPPAESATAKPKKTTK